jgi:hypothetical protein
MWRNEPKTRIDATSEGQPVIVLHDSGDTKYQAPKINDTMKPNRKIYFAKLGISPLISIHALLDCSFAHLSYLSFLREENT